MIVGRQSRNSIGATTMSEVIICLASFIAWLLIGNRVPSIPLMVSLSGGALIGGMIGPYLLSIIKNNYILTKIVSIMAIVSGIYALIKIL